jgi:hypothetical protein
LIIKTPDPDPDSLEMMDPDSGFNESGSTTLTFQMLGERNYLPAVFFQPPAAAGISQGISCHSIIPSVKGTEE